MVHEVVPAADLDTATAKLARTIADNAPLSLAGIKALIQRALAAREAVPHDDIDALIQASRRSQDASEGRRAMLEKRKPVFRGEGARREPDGEPSRGAAGGGGLRGPPA